MRQVAQLTLTNANFSAHGRMDINSKRTTYHHRHFDLRQLFQNGWHCASRSGMKIHAKRQFEQLGIVGTNSGCKMNSAPAPLCQPVNHAGAKSQLVIGNTGRATHSQTRPPGKTVLRPFT
jgi:hypothetical protein